MQTRRLIEVLFGLFFMMLAVLALFEAWQVSLVMALVAGAFFAHQAALGRRARRARPAPVQRRRVDDSQWARNTNWSRIGDEIQNIARASIRVANRNGVEAGFDELGRQIERAVDNWQSGPTAPPAEEPVPAARPKKSRPRRAQLVELGSDEAYAHAVDAARAAGLELSRTAVIPVDVGVITFLPGGERAIHRTTPLEPASEYLQPVVQLNMPTRAVGRIRYELVDSDGQALFIHEDHQSLERGVNLLMPPARLRAHSGMARYGDWRLVVTADGVTLLDHGFGWAEDPAVRLRRHLREDGELTPEARTLLDEETSGPGMSLDDLLGAQGGASASQAGRR